jgi:hypothetical protein
MLDLHWNMELEEEVNIESWNCQSLKLHTCFLLTTYGDQHEILHHDQKGFRSQRNTSRQIQNDHAIPKDAKYTSQDIYITYIDF